MNRLLPVLLVLFVVRLANADDSAAEIARLKSRVEALEAENKLLRSRLNDIAALASHPASKPADKLVIRLGSDDWGDAVRPDVLKVLNSAANPVWKSAGSPALKALVVENNSEGPLVAYKRKPGGDYRVLVNVGGRQWAQLAFQFSHEVSHVLSNYREVPNRQLWFEEAICECASLYALRQMGQQWKTSPPYPNWRSYADSLTDYATDRIDNVASIPEDDLATWYAANKETLDNNATKRDLNLIVAIRLLPIFEKHENSWTAVRKLNLGDPSENETLDRYLEGWYSRVGRSERAVVRDIAELFSLSLPEE